MMMVVLAALLPCSRLGLLAAALLLLELHLQDLNDALHVLLLALNRLLQRLEVLADKLGLGSVVGRGLCPGLCGSAS